MRSILVVASILPFPETRGDPVRVMQVLRELSKSTEVTLACVASPGGDAIGLKRELPQTHVLVFNRDKLTLRDSFGMFSRNALALVRSVPAWIEERRSTALSRFICLEHSNYDAIIALGEASAQYFKNQDIPWHWDKVNLLATSQKLAIQESKGLRSRCAAWVNYISGARYERTYLNSNVTVSVTNETEAARFEENFRRKPDCILYSSVPILEATDNGIRRERQALWLGNLSYQSNIGGLRRFLADGWKPFADRGWRLRVVGSDMSSSVENELSRCPGVQPIGFVENLYTELASATIGVVPLWSGGGTRIKTITMMAAGLPVLSSPAGLEGIPLSEDQPAAIVADEPQAFYRRYEEVTSRIPLSSLSERARRTIEQTFSAATIREQLEDLLRVAIRDAR